MGCALTLQLFVFQVGMVESLKGSWLLFPKTQHRQWLHFINRGDGYSLIHCPNNNALKKTVSNPILVRLLGKVPSVAPGTPSGRSLGRFAEHRAPLPLCGYDSPWERP